jgi:hypothetical protein
VSGALPNLLIIGAPKCGTTSLHNYLAAHPEIAMSDTKELNFFVTDGTWGRGVAWYEEQFDAEQTVRGESSTSYTRDRNAPEVAIRVGELLPEVKLIYLVRDPIDRIRSDYHHHRAKGREPLGMAGAVRVPGNRYVEASRYGTQLAPYVERFGSDRVLVETQERLLSERQECLKRIFGFLGVQDDLYLPEFDRRWERSEGKGWLYSLALAVRRRGIRLPKFLRWPAQRLQRSRWFGGGGESAAPPEVDPAVRAELTQQLRPEVAKLRDLTGKTFDEWSV